MLPSPIDNILVEKAKRQFKHKWKDWTAGCIAVTNGEIEEIYAAVKDGTPITIKP